MGFLIYWVLPILVGTVRLFAGMPAVDIYYRIYDTLSPEIIQGYLFRCLLYYLAFYGGAWVCSLLFPRIREGYRKIYFDIRLLDICLVCGALLAAFYAYGVRDILFKGYSEESHDIAHRGSFIASSLFLLSLAFLYSTRRGEIVQKERALREFLLNRYWIVYFVAALLVLSMGGRLYFASSILMVLSYVSLYIKRIRLAVAGQLALGATGILLLIRLLRMGGGESASIVHLFEEPIYTSLPLISFLRSERIIELIKAPIFLASDFINLLPSVLYPDKANAILDPASYGYNIEAPMGALNSFVSFSINFGACGTIMVLSTLSFALQYLKIRRDLHLARVLYPMLAGWLTFTFFRDAFSISIVKSMTEFTVVLPCVIALALWRLTVVLTPPTTTATSNTSATIEQQRA